MEEGTGCACVCAHTRVYVCACCGCCCGLGLRVILAFKTVCNGLSSCLLDASQGALVSIIRKDPSCAVLVLGCPC